MTCLLSTRARTLGTPEKPTDLVGIADPSRGQGVTVLLDIVGKDDDAGQRGDGQQHGHSYDVQQHRSANNTDSVWSLWSMRALSLSLSPSVCLCLKNNNNNLSLSLSL